MATTPCVLTGAELCLDEELGTPVAGVGRGDAGRRHVVDNVRMIPQLFLNMTNSHNSTCKYLPQKMIHKLHTRCKQATICHYQTR